MKCELKVGPRSLLLLVRFEGKPIDNFDKSDLTWVPTHKEIQLIDEALETLERAKK